MNDLKRGNLLQYGNVAGLHFIPCCILMVYSSYSCYTTATVEFFKCLRSLCELASLKRMMLQEIHFPISSILFQIHTLPETNIAPKNGGFQYQSPFPGGPYFQRLLLLVQVSGILVFLEPWPNFQPMDPINLSEYDWGVQSSPKRKVLRFHDTILRFGEPGSRGIR